MTDQTDRDGFELSATRRTLPMALLRLRERVMAEFRPIMSEHGVTEQQWRVLRVLMEVAEIDATELAERASILAPSLSRILKTLDGRGHIAMGRSPGDARRTLIRLTPEGEAYIRVMTPKSAAVYDRIEGLIGRERIQVLLDEIEAALEALDQDDRSS
ncbi:homoprotocatechuate degradation operon regulator HpaR [Pseudooceanicola sp.]|uniref:homoprotocatechuate degradation operon regulator HpaR n=1 Tax=Pseudooceanicola sp. TaxID=1914328 RepID=UPI0035C66799